MAFAATQYWEVGDGHNLAAGIPERWPAESDVSNEMHAPE